jgi:hypothetical protein
VEKKLFRFRRITALILCSMIAVAYARALNIQQQRKAMRNLRYGLYSAQDVIKRAQRIGERLEMLPAQSELIATTEAVDYGAGVKHVWEVECRCDKEAPCAEFVWNADTGGLIYVIANRPFDPLSPAEVKRSSIAPETALACGRRWAQCVAGGAATDWKLEGKLTEHLLIKSMTLVRGCQRVLVQVKASDGSLTCVRRYTVSSLRPGNSAHGVEAVNAN